MATRPLPSLALLSVLAVGGLLATGCNDRVKELEMANRSLSDRLSQAEAENERLRSENDQITAELNQQRNIVTQQSAEIQELRDANQELRTGLTNLKRMYDEVVARGPKIIRSPLPPALNTALLKFAEENPELAEYDEKNGMVKLKSDLTFPPGSATVGQDAAATLAKLVQILKSPDAEQFHVYIAGHTDDMPIGKPSTRRRHPTNWYLSVHRAVGVQKTLAEAGLDPDRIAVLGFGEYHPVEPNKPNKKGNRANRRVEIWIVPPGAFLTSEAFTPAGPTEPTPVEGS